MDQRGYDYEVWERALVTNMETEYSDDRIYLGAW